MRGRGAGDGNGAGGAESKLAKHLGSPILRHMNGGREARPRD
jgi:hypothetical protein